MRSQHSFSVLLYQTVPFDSSAKFASALREADVAIVELRALHGCGHTEVALPTFEPPQMAWYRAVVRLVNETIEKHSAPSRFPPKIVLTDAPSGPSHGHGETATTSEHTADSATGLNPDSLSRAIESLERVYAYAVSHATLL